MDPVSRAQTGNSQDRLSRFGDRLQQFQPGQSGNPSGRPRQRITKIYRRILNKAENRKQLEDAIFNILTGESRMAAVLMLREMSERVEGKVTQGIELSGSISTMTEQQVDERLAKLLDLELKNLEPSNEPDRNTITIK